MAEGTTQKLVGIIKSSNSPVNLTTIVFLILISLGLTLPVLTQIPPHPDEYQFYTNAWSIMSGKELANYLHVAFTEYSLAAFLTIVNLFTSSGVNFPQGSPSLVTVYYGRIFGLLLYLATFALGLVIVQKGENKIRLRSVFFTFLYLGSLGFFERFFRINSDSMMVFLFANYLIISLLLHQRKASLYHFFLVNLLFLFVFSFTNLKGIYLALPLLVINTLFPLIWYEAEQERPEFKLPVFYRCTAHLVFWFNLIFLSLMNFAGPKLLYWAPFLILANTLNPFLWLQKIKNGRRNLLLKSYKLFLCVVGLLAGAVFLWFLFMPRPYDPKKFWYTVKNTIVFGTQFDFDYPGQSHGSWAVYIYDLLVEYIGLNQFFLILTVSLAIFWVRGRGLFSKIIKLMKGKLNWGQWRNGNLYPVSEVILLLSFLTYYLGVSARVVHWSRWGVPLGFIAIILISSFLEKLILLADLKGRIRSGTLLSLALFSLVLGWFPRISLFVDLNEAKFPTREGHNATHEDVQKFLKEVGIPPKEATQSAAWFTGHTRNVGNISLEKLTESGYEKIRYLLWPAWNIGPLYSKNNVDRSTHNQRAFIEIYAENISYRFPTLISRYTHYTKYFAWKYLGLTYSPELESLVDSQYAVVKLKKITKPMNFKYDLNFDDLSHYYIPKSSIFNINNLPESYMFPPCYSNPAVAYVATGELVEVDPATGSRTAGLHCHSLRFRVAFKGVYLIKVEGLPSDLDKSQMVYSAYPYNWDAVNRVITFVAPQTFITVEFGVATAEKYIPSLKYSIYYQSLPDDFVIPKEEN